MALDNRKETEALVNAILTKDWSELQAQEYADYLLFPEELLQRQKDGTFKRHPVMLRVPREHEMRQARIEARAWAKQEGLEPDLDPDLFDNMDTMCTLVKCIRNTTTPFEPYEPDPKRLERVYDRPCLDALWAKVEAYRTVLDPRPNALSEEETLAIIGAVARARNIVPLAALGGQSQTNLIVSMACQLSSSPPSKS
jgi:hypothetical protein